MPLEIVVGTQWGDEGKGRFVDLLSEQASIVVRYNGGDNAGHTVTVGEKTFKLHLLPSGMIHPQTIGMLGNGMVINPVSLKQEMDMLVENGLDVSPKRLRISYAAHLITPAHKALDKAQEIGRGGASIGTTGRGIGPAYTDKSARRGLRMQDMLHPHSFREKFAAHINESNLWLTHIYNLEPLETEPLLEEFSRYAESLVPHITDVSGEIDQALRNGQNVLAEGAQGTLLDLDNGTYPFVTSSCPTAAGVFVGLGLAPHYAGRVVGVTKAFQTRVGSGPFPTEVFGETANRLRGTGSNPWDEFGTTTGRPRRVGWLDAVLLRYTLRLNGVTELAVTKLDILSGLHTVQICNAYKIDGKILSDLPMGPADLSPYQAVYEEFPGWQEDVQSARQWSDLPISAQNYIKRLEEVTGVPVRYVSVGAERSQVVRV